MGSLNKNHVMKDYYTFIDEVLHDYKNGVIDHEDALVMILVRSAEKETQPFIYNLN